MRISTLIALFIAASLFLAEPIFAADFNPTYPRTGIFQFGMKGPPEIYARFDYVFMTKKGNNLARAIKKISPDTVIVEADKDWNIFSRKEVPSKDWFVQDSKGNRVPIYGGIGDLVDITNYSPRRDSVYGNQRYNEFLVDFMLDGVDMSVFDGIGTHGVWDHPFGTSDVDLDRNGKNDWTEHSRAWLESVWRQGVDITVSGIRKRIGNNKIIVLNAGRFHDISIDKVNGLIVEQVPGIWNKYHSKPYDNFMRDAREPHFVLFDTQPSGSDPNRPANTKNHFTLMRFMLTATLYGDGYFSFSDIPSQNHKYDKYYDEYDLDLGYPTTNMKQVKTDVWVRFFEKGAAIMNLSGSNTTVTDSELWNTSGYNGPYYRFKGGQDPDFNNGQKFTSVTLFGDSIKKGTPTLYFGDGIILLKEPLTVISDIVIDNVDAQTSPASEPAILSSGWKQVCSNDSWTQRCWNFVFDQAESNNSGETAIFKSTIGVGGNYEIFEWHGRPSSGSACTSVKAELGNRSLGNIDQSRNSGKWNSLGTVTLPKGTSSSLKLISPGGCTAIADAVKFVYKDGAQSLTPTPTPPEVRGDLDKDGDVDIFDYNLLVENFGASKCGNLADINGDCKVDIFDYNILVENFGTFQ